MSSRRSSPWFASFVVACGSVAACVDAPSLTASNGTATDPSPSQPSPDPGKMVFVPSVTLDVGTLTPTSTKPVPKDDPAPPEGKGKGDKDEGDKADAGQPDTSSAPGGNKREAGGGGTPESPAPLVVPAFWIDTTEVDVASYRRCVAAGTCAAPAAALGCTFDEGLETHPVTCVTIEQARVFCTWNRKRLVRNDEYTAAGSGAPRRVYPWGAELPSADRLNGCGAECMASGLYAASDGFPRSAPVAAFPSGRTPEGVFDLAGNVAEWVEASAPTTRGGSYEDVDAASVSTTASRIGAPAGPAVGFRCAADAH